MKKDLPSLIALDVETTGLNPDYEKIIEIAIVKFVNGNIVDKFVSLINPEREIPIGAKMVNGIDESMVENAPKFDEVVKEIKEFLEGTTVIIHNADFDILFLEKEFRNCGEPFPEFDVIDTLYIARKYFDFRSNSLSFLAEHFGIMKQPHRAEGDAIIAYEIFERFRRELGDSIYNFKFSSSEIVKPGISESVFENKILIEQAIKKQKEIIIKYRNKDGEESERKIRPIEIVKKNGIIVVRAFCYRKNEEREFRLDRIVEFVDNVV